VGDEFCNAEFHPPTYRILLYPNVVIVVIAKQRMLQRTHSNTDKKTSGFHQSRKLIPSSH